MAEVTKIQWCDHTFNPWIGCAHAIYTGVDGNQYAHQGCLRCYAEADMDKRRGRVQWGSKGTRSRTSDNYWKQPLKWDRAAGKAGERRRVFCASLADVFEDWQGPIVNAEGDQMYNFDGIYRSQFQVLQGVGLGQDDVPVTMADLRRDLFKLIDATPNLDWLLLTKRPANVRRMWPRTHGSPKDQTAPDPSRVETGRYWHRSNAWLLASISDQPTADAMVPPLLQCADLVPVLGVSAEPLLGPIEFSDVSNRSDAVRQLGKKALDGIRWVIIGGESGPRARPCNLAWAKSLLDQCCAAGVAAYFKQAGSRPQQWRHPGEYPSDGPDAISLRDPKGGDLSELPAWCNVRQFPEVNHA